MKRNLARGFTLVELLIVIALLGIIATIVISAINPIEQANRAYDAGMKADASQVISAIERYYAAQSMFPWNAATCVGSGNCETGGVNGPDNAFGPGGFVSADDLAVGICGASGSSCRTTNNNGELINALELQKTFINKAWVGASSVNAKLWVGKAQGASSSVYVCWVPKSNSNRQVLINSLATGAKRMFDLTQAIPGGNNAGSGLPVVGACATTNEAGWTSGACGECLPE